MEPSTHGFMFFFEGAFFILFCITVPLYILIITVLLKAQLRKVTDLASPFFQICIVASFIDLVTLLNNYFGAVFPKWGWWQPFYLAMGEPYLKTYFFLAWGTGVCNALSVSIMATNRLYAMMYPENYSRAWTGWRLKAAISLQFFIGMSGSSANFFAEVGFVDTDDGIGKIPKLTNKSTSKLYFSIAGTFLAVNCFYLIGAYVYLFTTLRKRHNHQITRSSTVRIEKTKFEARRREQRLFIMSTCIVIVQLAIVCFSGLFIFPIHAITTEQFYMLYNALSDLYSSINAYLLLLFSDALRAYIRKLFGLQRKQIIAHSFISTPAQRSGSPQTSPVAKSAEDNMAQ